MSGMDRNAYLERIGFDGPADATAETLARLQEAHCRAVPYENFDILDGRPISLELPDLYRKVVAERRGGYCFELNGLFAWLLRELGFDVVEHFARYLRDEPPLPMPRRSARLKLPNLPPERISGLPASAGGAESP